MTFYFERKQSRAMNCPGGAARSGAIRAARRTVGKAKTAPAESERKRELPSSRFLAGPEYMVVSTNK